MSSKEHAQLTASRDQAVRTVTNEATKAESDATVSKVAAAGPNATEGAIEYANEKGIDLNQVEGTGAEGRITKNDVLEHEEKGGDANGG
jgi:pyruvate/2-oxoglutarate dehydrogenase complex dihydrolipoamide acyltransferase (E2) component